MSEKPKPNPYQLSFFRASNGRMPETPQEEVFAANCLPFSPEDSAWRHITNSARYAEEVVNALMGGDILSAQKRVQDFRDEGTGTRGFGKEALVKLVALNVLPEMYEGELNVLPQEDLTTAEARLAKLIALPRPQREE